MKKLTKQNKESLSKEFGLALSSLEAVIAVESGGNGFDEATGKIIIQFEPAWFKRKAPYTPSGAWSLNKVERQAGEWIAFNDAFSKRPSAAMESTSIGLMQVMGFHWKALGFTSVGAMWDYAKENEEHQLRLGLMFIRLNGKMYNALKKNDWATFAYYYNGSEYKKFNYDKRLKAAYEKANK